MGLVVLSLCDGISTGQYILNKLGIKVDKYFSSEIEENAMRVANFHFPNTIQIGDICNIKYDNGILYTEKENMAGVSGKLFLEFARILKEVKPTYFFFENVKMQEEVAKEINDILGVKYIYLNSVDFSCHIRKRYYWTNIVSEKDCLSSIVKKDLYIKDIVEWDKEFTNDVSEVTKRFPFNPITSSEGVITINPRDTKCRKNNPRVKAQTHQRARIYDVEGKCPTMCATLFDLKITKDYKKYRNLTIVECERLQGLPDGYTSMISRNGWQVDTVAHILKYLKE